MDKPIKHEDLDDLEVLIKEGSDEELGEFLRVLHPADIADLVEQMDEADRARIFALMPERVGADVLPEIEDHVFDEVIEAVPEDKLVEFVDEMDTDDAADILAELPRQQVRLILARIDASDSEDIRRLLDYGEETAGGLMQTELIAVVEAATVNDVIEEIRKQKGEVENVHYVFAVDEDKSLKGVLDLRDLLLASSGQKVSEITDPEVISAKVDMDQEEVISLMMKYDLVALPVTDNAGRLVGRIVIDDVMDALEDEVDEDFLLMAGAGEEELEELSAIKSVQARLPWLLITWVGGSTTAVIMDHFLETTDNMITLAAFIPIIMAMGGNVGTQAATIVVRGMATGRIDLRVVRQFFARQVIVGATLGVIIGLATAMFVLFRHPASNLAMIIGAAMISVMTFSASVGASLPWFFKRIGVDPAIATAPIIATFCDIMGIVIYFSLAAVMIP
jgi:magnesium transporter